MIQRVQSIYILVSAGLVISSLLSAFIHIIAPGTIIEINAFKILEVQEGIEPNFTQVYTIGVALSIVVVALLSAIFLFKNRPLQLRILKYSILLKSAVILVVAYFAYIIAKNTEIQMSIAPKTGALLIIVSIVVDWIAMKAIKRDEDLVKSVDRIR